MAELKAVIEIGVSWMFSATLRAVTTISSSWPPEPVSASAQAAPVESARIPDTASFSTSFRMFVPQTESKIETGPVFVCVRTDALIMFRVAPTP